MLVKTLLRCILFTGASLLLNQAARAQTSGTATQTVNLDLNPTIDISAVNAGTVQLQFQNVQHMQQGVTSGANEFRVRSNKTFVISVQSAATYFSYSGSALPAPSMPVANTLFLTVAQNNTGGSVNNTFLGYNTLSVTSQNLLTNCPIGPDQRFTVTYKATPGLQFPAGTYTTDILYTATQP